VKLLPVKKDIRFQQYSPPSLPKFRDNIEHVGFEYFQCKSAIWLSSALGWPDWGRVALQLSEQDTTVRHAIVGLGAVHDYHNQSRGFHKAMNTSLLHLSYRQYGQAIRQLRERIDSSDMSPVAVMVACTLFALFDFLQGDDLAATVHLKAGITLLRAHPGPADISVHIGSSQPGNLQRNLVSAFSHLDFFSSWWNNGETFMPDVSYTVSAEYATTVEDDGSMRFLLRYYNRLEQLIQEFLRSSKAKKSSCLARIELLEQLAQSRSRLCEIHSKEASEVNQRGQEVLMLNCDNLRIMLLACHNGYSGFDSAFESIVVRAASLSIDDQLAPTASNFQSFSFNHGMIYPLYIAATCCRDVDVCRQAIEVLRSFRWAEGVWNGPIMAKMAERKLRERLTPASEISRTSLDRRLSFSST
jgi:hypothetical protein